MRFLFPLSSPTHRYLNPFEEQAGIYSGFYTLPLACCVYFPLHHWPLGMSVPFAFCLEEESTHCFYYPPSFTTTRSLSISLTACSKYIILTSWPACPTQHSLQSVTSCLSIFTFPPPLSLLHSSPIRPSSFQPVIPRFLHLCRYRTILSPTSISIKYFFLSFPTTSVFSLINTEGKKRRRNREKRKRLKY